MAIIEDGFALGTYVALSRRLPVLVLESGRLWELSTSGVKIDKGSSQLPKWSSTPGPGSKSYTLNSIT